MTHNITTREVPHFCHVLSCLGPLGVSPTTRWCWCTAWRTGQSTSPSRGSSPRPWPGRGSCSNRWSIPMPATICILWGITSTKLWKNIFSRWAGKAWFRRGKLRFDLKCTRFNFYLFYSSVWARVQWVWGALRTQRLMCWAPSCTEYTPANYFIPRVNTIYTRRGTNWYKKNQSILAPLRER